MRLASLGVGLSQSMSCLDSCREAKGGGRLPQSTADACPAIGSMQTIARKCAPLVVHPLLLASAFPACLRNTHAEWTNALPQCFPYCPTLTHLRTAIANPYEPFSMAVPEILPVSGRGPMPLVHPRT